MERPIESKPADAASCTRSAIGCRRARLKWLSTRSLANNLAPFPPFSSCSVDLTNQMINNGSMTATQPRPARSPGITYQELLDADTHPVPDVLRLESPQFLGDADIAIERYTSYDWHRREVERLWMRA